MGDSSSNNNNNNHHHYSVEASYNSVKESLADPSFFHKEMKVIQTEKKVIFPGKYVTLSTQVQISLLRTILELPFHIFSAVVSWTWYWFTSFFTICGLKAVYQRARKLIGAPYQALLTLLADFIDNFLMPVFVHTLAAIGVEKITLEVSEKGQDQVNNLLAYVDRKVMPVILGNPILPWLVPYAAWQFLLTFLKKGEVKEADADHQKKIDNYLNNHAFLGLCSDVVTWVPFNLILNLLVQRKQTATKVIVEENPED